MLSPGCRRASNAARQATTAACVPAGGPGVGRRAAACAFYVSLDSSETKPATKKKTTRHDTSYSTDLSGQNEQHAVEEN